MGAEFNWWLLIVGVVAGGVLTWLVVADSRRREHDLDERELPAEAAWIVRYVANPRVDADAAEQILRAHRTYRGFPPPDVLLTSDEVERLAPLDEPEQPEEGKGPGEAEPGPG